MNFKQAPLPFQGQKRNYLKLFKEKLQDCPNDAIYVDLFGGSGLLSHTVKHVYPKAKVIYNDFDNYSERLQNVKKTNQLLSDLRELLKDYPRSNKLDEYHKSKVIDRIENECGFIDWRTISSSILFAMKYAYSIEELKKETMYNRIRKTDYKSDGYLNGLDIVTKDYRELYNEYKEFENVVFLVDPPYLSTNEGSYTNYWKLSDYLDVLDVIQDSKYFYFTSNKSQIIELCNWIANRKTFRNPFEGSQTCTMNANVTYNCSYKDIMVAKL